MNTLSGEIPVGSKRGTVANSQPAGLGFVGSFSSPMTPRAPTTAQADADGDSSGVGGDVTEFSGLTDERLLDSISRSRGMLSLRLPDGGEKMRVRICRMEKELARRMATGPRKDDMTWGPSVEPSCRDDSHAFKDGDKLNWETSPSKCHHNVPTNSTENYGQVDKFAFVKELSYFGQEKNTCLKKVGQSAQTPASHQPKNHAICPKSSGNKKLCMDSNITDNRRKTCFKGSLRNQQKNNSVVLKGIADKLYTKDVTFGRSTMRWEHSKIHIDFRNLFNSNKKNENKDVVLLDDEDMEPTELVDVEVADKWDESKIYYPSRTDRESVELLYSDMKCLEPEEYLKSPVINFYIQYLRKSRTRGDLYMFNTYFYRKLEELSRMGENDDTQFSKLRRWWKNIDIFRKAYIILPIHGM
ncbi:hypothetical protein GUJ93_ZPchr0001g32472 [Zizania palustris]|uniref:Ubiquitin-like protease family profile domain-containing protein n=1 Tax=Zizania palustris TaxID=103762 RepID=A0A8J5SDF8_ZIZPA|nr:hypothetical protein GUJ93_ZPchr0001g32472 [Zizania palustris]